MSARRRQGLGLLCAGLALIVLMPRLRVWWDGAPPFVWGLLRWLSPLGVALVLFGLYRWVRGPGPDA